MEQLSTTLRLKTKAFLTGLLVFAGSLVIQLNLNAQCSYLGTLNTTLSAPVGLGDTISVECLTGGEILRVTGMQAGVSYRVSTCGSPGFDSQLTLFPAGGGSPLAYDDDACAPQSYFDYTPSETGDFDILLSEYYCGVNAICMKLIVTILPCPPVYAYEYLSTDYSCPLTDIDFEAYGDGIDYTWNFGDGSPVVNNSYAVHYYDNPGTYTASVIVTNYCGSDTTIYRTVNIVNDIAVTYAYTDISPNPLCPGEVAYFQGWGDGTSFEWDFGDGSPVETNGYTSHSYSSTGIYVANMTMANGCGSDTTLSTTVVVEFSDEPVAGVGYYIDPNPACPNTEIQFGAWADAVSYEWNFGDGSPVSTNPYSYHSYSSFGSYTAVLTITNACGNDTVITETINITNTVPVSSASSYVSTNTACPNTWINFDAYGDAVSFEWDFGDGSPVATEAYTSHMYTSIGFYTASVTLTNSCGSDTVLYHGINITNNLPVEDVYAAAYPNTACPNTEIRFERWGQGNSQIWNFGDGSPTTTEVSPYHSYALAGNYLASVVISNTCGSDTTLYIPVTIGNFLPVSYANAQVYPNLACPNTEVFFDAWGDAVTFQWNFGDGSPLDNQVDTYHTYALPGIYNASCTMTNACGNDTTLYLSVTIANNLPVNYASADVYPEMVCPNTEIHFNAYGDVVSFLWNFGDGSPSSNQQNGYHTYSSVGLYNISVTMENACGGDTTLYRNVLVSNSIPVSYAEFYADPQLACPNSMIYLDAWGEGITSTVYDYGDGSPVSFSDEHYYTSTGVYTLSATLTNECGNDTTLYQTIVISNDVPVNSLEVWVSEGGVCPNSEVYFEAWGSGIASYEWDFGDGSPVSPFQYTTHKYAAPGLYVASLTVVNTCGNDTTIYRNIEVTDNLYIYDAWFDIYPQVVCPNSTVRLDVDTNSSDSLFIFNFGDGSPSMTTQSDYVYHTYSDAGMYTASVKIINFCGNDTVLYRSVQVMNNLPVQYWEEDMDIYPNPVCPNSTVYFEGDESTYYFQWDFGDGSPAMTGNNVTHSYTTAGVYDITVVVSNTCGNDTSFQRTVIVDEDIIPNPTAEEYDYDVVPPYACAGDSVIFYFQADAGTYLWDFGDGNSTSTIVRRRVEGDYAIDMAKHAYASNGTYNASLTFTNSCGNSFTDNFTVIVADNIPVEGEFWWLNEQYGAGENVEFIAYGGSTYEWDFGDGTPVVTTHATLEPVYHAYASEGNYAVNVTVTNNCGNSVTVTDYIYISSGPYCSAMFDVIPGEPASFYDLSAGNPTNWSWDFGDGSYSNDQNPLHTYSSPGVYTVTLTIFNAESSCISTITRQITSGTVECLADFDVSMNIGNGVASFTSTAINATDYHWDFGDGEYSISVDPSHTYTIPGVYPVCLSIWNSVTGCQSFVCKDVVYVPEDSVYLAADFSFFTDPVSNEVTFNDLSTENTTDWYWTMGDGMIMTDQDPVYIYPKPGVYTVCLTAIDRDNFLLQTVCKDITVGEIECNVGSDFSYFIDPQNLGVAFFNKSKGTITDYFWTFGDGMSSTLENPSYTYSVPGYYLVSLAVRNNVSGCMDVYAQFIQVGSVDCHAGFSFGIDPLTNTVNFKDESKGEIDFYFWDFGNGAFSTDENPVYIYKSGGMYYVGQTVFDNVNGCIDYAVQTVQVGEIDCAADFIAYVDSATSTVYFTSQVLGGSTAMLWSFGDGSFSTEENPVHQFPGGGIYYVGLNTYDFNTGCMDYVEDLLLIGGLGNDCEADFVYRVDNESAEVTFSNKSVGTIVESVWNFGDLSENSVDENPVHSFPGTGYYYVCLNVTNSQNIRNMTCKWVLIEGEEEDYCLANFMYSIDTTSREVTFIDNSFGNINKYSWDFGDNSPDSVSSEKDPSHTYSDKGYYLVKLKVENTVSGCESKEYKLLNVADEQVLKAAFGYEALEPDKKIAGYPVDMVSASSGDGATVEWDFGDKQIKKDAFTVMDSTSGKVTHYYQKPGKYLVCLRISDPVSGQSDEYCQYVFTKNAVAVEETELYYMTLDVYPNPFMNYTSITYTIPDAQVIEMAIFDQLGRRIETLVKTRKEAGNHEIIWETRNLPAGVYHLKLITGDEILTRQLMIAR